VNFDAAVDQIRIATGTGKVVGLGNGALSGALVERSTPALSEGVAVNAAQGLGNFDFFALSDGVALGARGFGEFRTFQ